MGSKCCKCSSDKKIASNSSVDSYPGQRSRVWEDLRYMEGETEWAVPGGPPLLSRRLTDQAVKVGTRTRLLVEIASSSPLTVVWLHDGKKVEENDRIKFINEGNFYCVDVSPVTMEDEGSWTCQGHNAGGLVTSQAKLTLVVPRQYKKPEFVEPLRAILGSAGTVSLETKVIGVPTPTLKWYKEGEEIKPGDVLALTPDPKDPSLGTYTCVAVNCMGTAVSTSRVHVVSPAHPKEDLGLSTSGPKPIFAKELRNEKIKIGGSLHLECQVKVPPWPDRVSWYNSEGEVKEGPRAHLMEDGMGGYSIRVSPMQASDDGLWRFVATNRGGATSVTTCTVSVSYPKNYRKPKFLDSLKAVLTEEGLVSFECKVVGYPTPQLSWFKDGQELKPGDVYQLTGTNSLGSYCCIARNCMGEAESTAVLTVEDIQSQLTEEERLQLFSDRLPPKFIQGLKSMEAKISEPLTFTVKVSVSPEPTILWFRDDEHIDEGETRYKIEKDKLGLCSLHISRLEFVDQAEWKCVAMNDYGQSVTSAYLKLNIPRHYKKPKFLEELRAVLSDEGAVNLECKVIGVPQPVLKWFKDGKELKPGDIHRIISGQDGSCCLGTYTCMAQNCMGTVSSSASLLGFQDKSVTSPGRIVEKTNTCLRDTSLSTIQEERTSQMHDTDRSLTLDDRPEEVSFSFDGREVSVSLYETPDLTEEEALQIVEMYADQISEHVSEYNVVELPPMRFTKESSNSGKILMEAMVIDVSPDYFTPAEVDDLRTDADLEEFSLVEETMVTPDEEKAEAFFPSVSDLRDIPLQKDNEKPGVTMPTKEERTKRKKKRSTDSEKEDDSLQEFERRKTEKRSFKERRRTESEMEDDSLYEFESRKAIGQSINKPTEVDLDLDKETAAESGILKESEVMITEFNVEEPVSPGTEGSKPSMTEAEMSFDTAESVFEKSEVSVLESLAQSLHEIQRGLANVEAKAISESLEIKSPPVSVLESLAQPLADVQRSLEVMEEKLDEGLIGHEVLETLVQPINEFRKNLKMIEEEEAIHKRASSIMESLAKPLQELEKEIQLIQEQCIPRRYSSEERYAKTVEEVQETLTRIIERQESVPHDRKLMKTISVELQELEETASDDLEKYYDRLLACGTEIRKKLNNETDQEIIDILRSICDLVKPLKHLTAVTSKCISVIVKDYESQGVPSAKLVESLIKPLEALKSSLDLLESVSSLKSHRAIRGAGIPLLYKLSVPMDELETTIKLVENLSAHTAVEFLVSPLENLMKVVSEIDISSGGEGFLENMPVDGSKLLNNIDDSMKTMITSVASIKSNAHNVGSEKELIEKLPNIVKPTEDLQRSLKRVEEAIGEELSYDDVCELAQNLSKPLQSLRSELSILQHEIEIEQYGDITGEKRSALSELIEPLEAVQNSISTFHESVLCKEDPIHLRFVLYAIKEMEEPLKVLSSKVIQTEQAVLQGKVLDPFQGLKNVAKAVRELRETSSLTKTDLPGIFSISSMLAEPLEFVEFGLVEVLNKVHQKEKGELNMNLLKTMAEPLQELQSALLAIDEKGLTNDNEATPLKQSIQDLKRSILVIQDQSSFEYGDEPSTIESTIGTLESLIQPLHTMRSQLSEVQRASVRTLIKTDRVLTDIRDAAKDVVSAISVNKEVEGPLSSILVSLENAVSKLGVAAEMQNIQIGQGQPLDQARKNMSQILSSVASSLVDACAMADDFSVGLEGDSRTALILVQDMVHDLKSAVESTVEVMEDKKTGIEQSIAMADALEQLKTAMTEFGHSISGVNELEIPTPKKSVSMDELKDYVVQLERDVNLVIDKISTTVDKKVAQPILDTVLNDVKSVKQVVLNMAEERNLDESRIQFVLDKVKFIETDLQELSQGTLKEEYSQLNEACKTAQAIVSMQDQLMQTSREEGDKTHSDIIETLIENVKSLESVVEKITGDETNIIKKNDLAKISQNLYLLQESILSLTNEEEEVQNFKAKVREIIIPIKMIEETLHNVQVDEVDLKEAKLAIDKISDACSKAKKDTSKVTEFEQLFSTESLNETVDIPLIKSITEKVENLLSETKYIKNKNPAKLIWFLDSFEESIVNIGKELSVDINNITEPETIKTILETLDDMRIQLLDTKLIDSEKINDLREAIDNFEISINEGPQKILPAFQNLIRPVLNIHESVSVFDEKTIKVAETKYLENCSKASNDLELGLLKLEKAVITSSEVDLQVIAKPLEVLCNHVESISHDPLFEYCDEDSNIAQLHAMSEYICEVRDSLIQLEQVISLPDEKEKIEKLLLCISKPVRELRHNIALIQEQALMMNVESRVNELEDLKEAIAVVCTHVEDEETLKSLVGPVQVLKETLEAACNENLSPSEIEGPVRELKLALETVESEVQSFAEDSVASTVAVPLLDLCHHVVQIIETRVMEGLGPDEVSVSDLATLASIEDVTDSLYQATPVVVETNMSCDNETVQAKQEILEGNFEELEELCHTTLPVKDKTVEESIICEKDEIFRDLYEKTESKKEDNKLLTPESKSIEIVTLTDEDYCTQDTTTVNIEELQSSSKILNIESDKAGKGYTQDNEEKSIISDADEIAKFAILKDQDLSESPLKENTQIGNEELEQESPLPIDQQHLKETKVMSYKQSEQFKETLDKLMTSRKYTEKLESEILAAVKSVSKNAARFSVQPILESILIDIKSVRRVIEKLLVGDKLDNTRLKFINDKIKFIGEDLNFVIGDVLKIELSELCAAKRTVENILALNLFIDDGDILGCSAEITDHEGNIKQLASEKAIKEGNEAESKGIAEESSEESEEKAKILNETKDNIILEGENDDKENKTERREKEDQLIKDDSAKQKLREEQSKKLNAQLKEAEGTVDILLETGILEKSQSEKEENKLKEKEDKIMEDIPGEDKKQTKHKEREEEEKQNYEGERQLQENQKIKEQKQKEVEENKIKGKVERGETLKGIQGEHKNDNETILQIKEEEKKPYEKEGLEKRVILEQEEKNKNKIEDEQDKGAEQTRQLEMKFQEKPEVAQLKAEQKDEEKMISSNEEKEKNANLKEEKQEKKLKEKEETLNADKLEIKKLKEREEEEKKAIIKENEENKTKDEENILKTEKYKELKAKEEEDSKARQEEEKKLKEKEEQENKPKIKEEGFEKKQSEKEGHRKKSKHIQEENDLKGKEGQEKKAKLTEEEENVEKEKEEQEKISKLKVEKANKQEEKEEQQKKTSLKKEEKKKLNEMEEHEKKAKMKAEEEKKKNEKGDKDITANLTEEEEKKQKDQEEQTKEAELKVEEEEKLKGKGEQGKKTKLKKEEEKQQKEMEAQEHRTKLKEEEQKVKEEEGQEKKAELEAEDEKKQQNIEGQEKTGKHKNEEQEKLKEKEKQEKEAKHKEKHEKKLREKEEQEKKVKLEVEEEKEQKEKEEQEKKSNLKAEEKNKQKGKEELETETKLKSEEEKQQNEKEKQEKKTKHTEEEDIQKINDKEEHENKAKVKAEEEKEQKEKEEQEENANLKQKEEKSVKENDEKEKKAKIKAEDAIEQKESEEQEKKAKHKTEEEKHLKEKEEQEKEAKLKTEEEKKNKETEKQDNEAKPKEDKEKKLKEKEEQEKKPKRKTEEEKKLKEKEEQEKKVKHKEDEKKQKEKEEQEKKAKLKQEEEEKKEQEKEANLNTEQEKQQKEKEEQEKIAKLKEDEKKQKEKEAKEKEEKLKQEKEEKLKEKKEQEKEANLNTEQEKQQKEKEEQEENAKHKEEEETKKNEKEGQEKIAKLNEEEGKEEQEKIAKLNQEENKKKEKEEHEMKAKLIEEEKNLKEKEEQEKKTRLKEEEEKKKKEKDEQEKKARLKEEEEKKKKEKEEQENKAKLKEEEEKKLKEKEEQEKKARLKEEEEKKKKEKEEQEKKARLKEEEEKKKKEKEEQEKKAKLKEEQEKKLKEKEEQEIKARLKEEEEEKKKKEKEEQEKKAKLKEEEDKKLKEKEEQDKKAKLKAEEEKKKKLNEEQEKKAKLKEEEEKKLKEKQEEEKIAKLKEEEKKMKEKEEQDKKAKLKAEEEKKKKEKEEEDKKAKLKEEEEKKLKEKQEEEKRAKLKEEEKKMKEKEEQDKKAKLKAEEEKKKKEKEEEDKKSKLKEEEEKKLKEKQEEEKRAKLKEEDKKMKEKEEQDKKAKLKAEEEKKKKEKEEEDKKSKLKEEEEKKLKEKQEEEKRAKLKEEEKKMKEKEEQDKKAKLKAEEEKKKKEKEEQDKKAKLKEEEEKKLKEKQEEEKIAKLKEEEEKMKEKEEQDKKAKLKVEEEKKKKEKEEQEKTAKLKEEEKKQKEKEEEEKKARLKEEEEEKKKKEKEEQEMRARLKEEEEEKKKKEQEKKAKHKEEEEKKLKEKQEEEKLAKLKEEEKKMKEKEELDKKAKLNAEEEKKKNDKEKEEKRAKLTEVEKVMNETEEQEKKTKIKEEEKKLKEKEGQEKKANLKAEEQKEKKELEEEEKKLNEKEEHEKKVKHKVAEGKKLKEKEEQEKKGKLQEEKGEKMLNGKEKKTNAKQGEEKQLVEQEEQEMEEKLKEEEVKQKKTTIMMEEEKKLKEDRTKKLNITHQVSENLKGGEDNAEKGHKKDNELMQKQINDDKINYLKEKESMLIYRKEDEKDMEESRKGDRRERNLDSYSNEEEWKIAQEYSATVESYAKSSLPSRRYLISDYHSSDKTLSTESLIDSKSFVDSSFDTMQKESKLKQYLSKSGIDLSYEYSPRNYPVREDYSKKDFSSMHSSKPTDFTVKHYSYEPSSAALDSLRKRVDKSWRAFNRHLSREQLVPSLAGSDRGSKEHLQSSLEHFTISDYSWNHSLPVGEDFSPLAQSRRYTRRRSASPLTVLSPTMDTNVIRHRSKSRTRYDYHERQPYICSPLRDKRVEHGANVKLTCNIGGEPEPTVQWRKDGQPIESIIDRFAMEYSFGVASLEIKSVIVSDAGQYTCIAINSAGQAATTATLRVNTEHWQGIDDYGLSQEVSLPLRIPEKSPRVIGLIADSLVPSGGVLALHLQIEGCPRAEVTWLKEGSPVRRSPRLHTLVDYSMGLHTLLLESVTLAEGGLYHCRVVSGVSRLQEPAPAHIQVVERRPGDKPALITARPETRISLTSGEDLTLTCYISGEPKPRVMLMKGLKDITDGGRTLKESFGEYVRLTLKRALPEDSGTYFIIARNPYGTDRAFTTVKVYPKNALMPISENANSQGSVGDEIRERTRSLTPTRRERGSSLYRESSVYSTSSHLSLSNY